MAYINKHTPVRAVYIKRTKLAAKSFKLGATKARDLAHSRLKALSPLWLQEKLLNTVRDTPVIVSHTHLAQSRVIISSKLGTFTQGTLVLQLKQAALASAISVVTPKD